jgi:hypothetical protein
VRLGCIEELALEDSYFVEEKLYPNAGQENCCNSAGEPGIMR